LTNRDVGYTNLKGLFILEGTSCEPNFRRTLFNGSSSLPRFNGYNNLADSNTVETCQWSSKCSRVLTNRDKKKSACVFVERVYTAVIQAVLSQGVNADHAAG